LALPHKLDGKISEMGHYLAAEQRHRGPRRRQRHAVEVYLQRGDLKTANLSVVFDYLLCDVGRTADPDKSFFDLRSTVSARKPA
jgi:hypothetical protein